MNALFTADYVIGVVTLSAAILGLFGGFSGALAFCAGLVAAAVGGKCAYAFLASFFAARWSLALAALVVALLAFGLARLLVKHLVKGLLAQPADAIFGGLVAALTGAAGSILVIVAANRLLDAQIASSVGDLLLGFFPGKWGGGL